MCQGLFFSFFPCLSDSPGPCQTNKVPCPPGPPSGLRALWASRFGRDSISNKRSYVQSLGIL
ncbi:hypothetical protein Mapa_003306 [Marchantia paleacea]|nr:hypothetical protein Mapa_003306 [Marchantia paleacea]